MKGTHNLWLGSVHSYRLRFSDGPVSCSIVQHQGINAIRLAFECLRKMYPSYPQHRRHSGLSVRFSVPNQNIVKRILDDSFDEENLRVRAAANVLFPHIDKLSNLMSRHRIQIETISPNQLGVTLFLPPPPCPPPKSKMFSKLKRMVTRRPEIDSTEEPYALTQLGQNVSDSAGVESEWMTLYQYIPLEQQDVCMLTSVTCT